jgi:Fe2+ transport system protein FeoA
VVLAAAETWAQRQSMGPDGIAYLDIGDAYWRGDWHMAINASWSPFYSWLLGLSLKMLRPSAQWEFPSVHLVNFVIFLGALVCFEFLLWAWMHYRREGKRDGEIQLVGLPDWAWFAIGYTLFVWASFRLIRLETVTPDMCLAGFVFLGLGLLLRIRAGSATWLIFVLFGVVLGFGYLAKSMMFPIAVVFLASALFSGGSVSKAAPRVLVAALAFLAVSGPFAIALSRAVGRPTFGEAGKLNYIWFVDRKTPSRPGPDTVKHEPTQIYRSPAAIEFAQPIGGTFPLWYEPAYWNEGLKAHFNLRGQIRVLTAGLIDYYNLLFVPEAGLMACVLVLFCLSPAPTRSLRTICANWHVWLVPLVALSAYALILVEARYLGPFVPILWLGILSGVLLPRSAEARKLVAGAVLAIVLTMGGEVVFTTLHHVVVGWHDSASDWEVAQALTQMGIHAGDKVAYIRRSPWGDFYWARLGRIRIIAEIPPDEVDKFWASSPAVQADVIHAFTRVGAKAVIAGPDPHRPGVVALPPCASHDWLKLANSDFYAYAFPSNAGLESHGPNSLDTQAAGRRAADRLVPLNVRSCNSR